MDLNVTPYRTVYGLDVRVLCSQYCCHPDTLPSEHQAAGRGDPPSFTTGTEPLARVTL